MDIKGHIRTLAATDGRYNENAFFFVSEAINFTVSAIKQGKITISPNEFRGDGDEFHVSGKELLEGIRLLAQERWGILAPLVFHRWGVFRTEDFGEIVFLMVEDEKMAWSRRECDSREDFRNGYDFATAFTLRG